jgi:hypothetical protein
MEHKALRPTPPGDESVAARLADLFVLILTPDF